MRTIDLDLQLHLNGEATSICTCWIIRRVDGAVFGFTDHDNDLDVSNVVCKADTRFQATEAASELGLPAFNQEIEGVLSSDAISEDDLKFGLYDNAQVEVWLANWSAPSQNVHLRTAILGELSLEDGLFRAELRGQSSLLEQRVGRTYSRQCDAALGDAKCGVDLDQPVFKTNGSIVEIIGRRSLRCSGLDGFEQSWFSRGLLTFTSGRNQGLELEVSASADGGTDLLSLWKAAPLPLAIGDAFNLTAGCDKTFATCKAKFDNHLNFRGCPHIPGSDFALSYASSAVIHDGSPLIK